MAKKGSGSKMLPLTEATYYILLALVKPNHGYAVMQEAENISNGTLRLAPGTLYGAFSNLEDSGLIVMVGKEGRRKIYQITDKGLSVLQEQIQRLKIMLRYAEDMDDNLAKNRNKEGDS